MDGPARLLVIVIDAASPVLLERWAADGTLPALRALLAGARVATVRGIDAVGIGATWPSFYSGANPGRHGLYWVERWVPGTYTLAPCGAAEFRRLPVLWDVLAAAGRRVCTIDVPLCPPSPGLAATQVTGWGDHDAVFPFDATPAARALVAAVGAHPAPRRCDARQRTAADYRAFAGRLVRGAAARGELVTRALAAAPWEFAIAVFSEAHCAGHQCWHLHDAAHPSHDPAAAAIAGDPVRDVYVAIDRAIGRIVAAAPPGTTIAVATLHGMAHLGGASTLLGPVLERLGATVPAQAPPPAGGAVRGVLAPLWRTLPAGWRRAAMDVRHRVRDARDARRPPAPRAIAIDAAASRCFALDCGTAWSGIRLNVAGREPAGVLTPGAAADAFARDLASALLELVDPDTGRPWARSVRRAGELFHGARTGELPDLLVEWDVERPLGTVSLHDGRGAVLRAVSPRIGTVEVARTYARTGDHRRDGLVAVRGAGIEPGRHPAAVSLLDLAPTFAAALGCAFPDADGAPVDGLFATSRGHRR